MKANEVIVSQFLDLLKHPGQLPPWRRPWRITGGPRNALSGREYGGINALMLNMWGSIQGYSDPRYITFNATMKEGGRIKKGAKSMIVQFWKFTPRPQQPTPEGESQTHRGPISAFYRVFNVQETEGLDLPPINIHAERRPIMAAEKILDDWVAAPTISWHEKSAFYLPKEHHIGMPPRSTFVSDSAVYATLFHELGHSTAYPAYNCRPRGTSYAREELVAELCSVILQSEAGILDPDATSQAAAYLDHWIKSGDAAKDPNALIVAASAAQKAARFILGIANENETAADKAA